MTYHRLWESNCPVQCTVQIRLLQHSAEEAKFSEVCWTVHNVVGDSVMRSVSCDVYCVVDSEIRNMYCTVHCVVCSVQCTV